MKRITFWCLSTLTVLVLLLGYHTSTSSTMATSSPTVVVSGGSTGTSRPTTGSTPAASGGSSGSGGKSGSASSARSTVTGAVASTQWGPVQVELTLSGGKITKVSVLQYPSGNPRDDEINSYALPILIQETEQSQNARIDMVSGATVTSTGYLQSLQSALDKGGV